MNIEGYMKRVLPRGINAAGINFAAQLVRKSDGSTYFKHYHISNIRGMAAYLQKLSAEGKDVFVVQARFKIMRTKNVAGQDVFYRKQENVATLRSFFVDIDLSDDPKKGYATKQQMLQAVNDFLTDTGLPKMNLVIDTGGGIHGYWILSEEIVREEWQRTADLLKQVCYVIGLRIDPTVTADAARVLRPPNTYNWKRAGGDITKTETVTVLGHSKQDVDYADFKKRLEAVNTNVTGATPVSGKASGVFANEVNTGNLGAGISAATNSPIYMSEIVTKCGVAKTAVETGGRTFGYETWRRLLLLAAFTEDGEDFIHKMSDQHADYTRKKTQKKYAEQLADRKSKVGLGPPLCKKMKEYQSTICQSCSYNVNSPISLGHKEAPDDDKYPPGYIVDGSGIYGFQTTKEDGPIKILLCSTCVSDPELVYKDGKEYLHLKCTTFNSTNYEELEVPLLFQGKAAVVPFLAGKRLTVAPGTAEELFRKFFMAWVNELRRSRGSVEFSNQGYGWTTSPTSGFAYGGKLHCGGKTLQHKVSDRGLLDTYSAHGKLKPWKKVAKFLIETDGRPEMQVLLATAFAAPLMDMTGIDGLTMGFVSKDSGVGKTTAMKVAQAVWGHPVLSMNSFDDTHNSIMRKLGVTANLPAYWDELHVGTAIKAFLAVTHRIGQGKEKSRLSSGGAEQLDTVSWSTLLVAASNEHLTSYAGEASRTTTAGYLRVFEILFDPAPQDRNLSLQQAINRLKSNYGHAGALYAAHLGAHRAAIEKLLEHETKRISKDLDTNREERFWLAGVTVVLVGAAMANSLGLTQFDLKVMRTCMYQAVKIMRRRTRVELDSFEILSRFLDDERNRRLVLESVPQRRGRPITVTVLERPAEHIKSVTYQIIVKQRLLQVRKDRFYDYLRDKRIDPGAIERDFADKLTNFVSGKQVTLGLGMSMQTSRQRVMEFDLTDGGVPDDLVYLPKI